MPGRVSSASAWSPPAIATFRPWTSPPECSTWHGKKNIYGQLWQMTLGEHLTFASDTFDAVIGVGVFTTGHAPARAFDELVRITRDGGHIVFSLKTDLYEQEGFGQHLADLEAAGRWRPVERSKRYHPLPKGEPEVVHRVWVYQVSK